MSARRLQCVNQPARCFYFPDSCTRMRVRSSIAVCSPVPQRGLTNTFLFDSFISPMQLTTLAPYLQRDGDVEKMLNRATDNNYYSPSLADLNDLAILTHVESCRLTIVKILCRRCKRPGHWRRMHKALVVMHFLACNGALEIVADFRSHISALEDAGPSPVNGEDRALDIQRQAARLADLLSNEPVLAAARTRAQQLQADSPNAQVDSMDVTEKVVQISESAVKVGRAVQIYAAFFQTGPESLIKVALEVPSKTDRSSEVNMQIHMRALIAWAGMRHDHIQPTFGIYIGLGPHPAVVSPWSENGNIIEYLATSRRNARFLPFTLLLQVLQGLQYLHEYSPTIVHGNVRGSNVLIARDGRAQLAGCASAFPVVKSASTVAQAQGVLASRRWMSPELLATFGRQPTVYSDIWAVGNLMLEIFRRLEPYHYLAPGQDATGSELPARRSDCLLHTAGNDDIWPSVLACWQRKPLLRPSVVSLQEYILQNLAPKFADSVRQCRGLLDDDVLRGLEYFFGTEYGRMAWQQFHAEAQYQITPSLVDILNRCIMMFSSSVEVLDKLVERNAAAASEMLQHLNRRWLRPPIHVLRPLAHRLAALDLGHRYCSHFLSFASSSLIATIVTTGDPISAVAAGINGYDIVIGHLNGVVDVWTAKSDLSFSRTMVSRVTAEMEGTATVLAVSPSGASTATFSRGEEHILRSIVPGDQPLTVAKEVVVSRDAGTVRALCLSPCARRVAAITDNRLILWDTNAKDLYARLPTNNPNVITFSPDGQFVACVSRGRGGMLSVWDFRRRLQVLSTPHGHKGGVTAVAYSADCSIIYSGSEDRTVRMTSASTGAPLGDLFIGHRAGVTCVVSSPDSQDVASGSSDGSIIIWDVKSCKATRRLWCHTTGTTLKCLSGPLGDQDAEYRRHAVTALAYSANGRRLISASTDGVVRIWDTTGAWRQYDASSDIWGHNVKVANALLGRLKTDLQFGSGADLRRNTTLLR